MRCLHFPPLLSQLPTLKIMQTYYLTLLEVRSPGWASLGYNGGVGNVTNALESLPMNPFLFLSSFQRPPASLAGGPFLHLQRPSLGPLLSSAHFFLWLNLPLIRTFVIPLGLCGKSRTISPSQYPSLNPICRVTLFQGR